MQITSLKSCLSTFWQKVKPSWRKFEPQTKQSGTQVRKYKNCIWFLSIHILRDHSKWRANKNKHGEGIILIPTFVLKVIDDERKKLTHHEITDRIAEQTEFVITQVCKESKLWIHPNLQRPRFSFPYSFKFTYKCFLRLAFHNSYERY